MFRALFLNRDLEYHGGVSNVLLTLARGSDRSRADLRFGSLMKPSDAIRDAFKQIGIDLLCVGDKGYRKPAKALRKYVKENKIDFIVASAFKAALVAKAATIGLNCRVVHYIHAIDLVLEGKFKRKLFAAIAHNDPMMFVSKAVQQAHRPKSHKGPVAVVYNGVRDPFDDPETQPYPRDFRGEFGVPDDGVLLAYIGAFVGWKDHATMLRAFQLLDLKLNAYLLLIGKGEPGSTVEARVKQINNPRIQIVSPRPDARRILGAVDVYVHSSRREGFGLAVVEAMLAGRPVVATREGAFIEYIEDGKTGMLAEPGQPTSFAEKIERVARDRDFAARIAFAGQEAAKVRFDPKTCAAAVCDFLDCCLRSSEPT